MFPPGGRKHGRVMEARRAGVSRAWVGTLLIALATAGCVSQRRDETSSAPSGAAAGQTRARAEIKDVGGRILARAEAAQVSDGVRVRVDAYGMRQGAYAVHLHPIGSCVPPSFDSAGKHWNPAGHQHGRDNPLGAHLGDLPNLVVGADGRGRIEYLVRGARLRDGAASLLDSDGGSILIHVNADDYRTDPSGNSGAKIGCGVFG